jgi:protein TonB
MSAIVLRLINAALGRPSLARAYVCSLALHLGVAAATCCWWSNPVERMALAGARQTVRIEAVLSPERSQSVDVVMVPLERKPVPVPMRPVEFVSVSKSPPAASRSHVAPTVEAEFADAAHPCVRSDLRRADDMPSSPAGPPLIERLARLPHHEPERWTPRTSVAAEQAAGVEDRTPPDFFGNRPPAYPAAAVARSLEGTVLLRLHIAATGQVQRVEVVTSSGYDILDRAAVEAVSTWRGRPAQQAGMPLASVELLPVRFRL